MMIAISKHPRAITIHTIDLENQTNLITQRCHKFEELILRCHFDAFYTSPAAVVAAISPQVSIHTHES